MRIDALINYKDNNGINNVIYPVTKKSNVIDLEQDLASMASSINSATQAVAGKVDKVEGKGLSAEDFTTAEKSKLAGIEAGATAVHVDSELSNTSTNPVQNKVVYSAVNGKVDKVTGKGLSTNDFTDALYDKLDGIEVNANNYVHPTTSGYKHIPSGGSSGKVLGWSADGTAQWVDSQGGEYEDATETTHGLMSVSDKIKLDGIAAGATAVTVDSSLSSSSENPVQNKIIDSALNSKVDKAAGKGLSSNDYTTAEKQKLANIEAEANKTIVDNALSSSSENPVQNKVIESALSGKANFSNIDFFENSIKYHKTVYQGTTFYYSIIPATHKPELLLAHNHIDDVQESVDMATSNHATVAINAGIFSVDSNLTAGIIVQNGAVMCKRGGLVGVKNHLYMSNTGRLDVITSSGDIDADVAQLDLPNTKWCVTGWGAMINNHTVAWQDSDQSPKSVIGQDDNGDYIIIITDGRDYSESGTPATKVCDFVESLNFDARILYQLDGGGSCCFYNRGVRANKLVQNEDRHVANMLAFGQKTSTNDDLYLALSAISEQNVRARRNNLFYQGDDVFKIYSSHSVPGIEVEDVINEGGHVYSYPRIFKIGFDKSNYELFIDAQCEDGNYKNVFKIGDEVISLSRVQIDIQTGRMTLRNGVEFKPIRDVLELLSGTYDLNDIDETSFNISGSANIHNPISDTAAVITLNGSEASTYYQILTDGFRLYIRNKGYNDWIRVNGAEPSNSFPTDLSRARYNGTMRFDLTTQKTYTFYEGVWYDAMGNPKQ